MIEEWLAIICDVVHTLLLVSNRAMQKGNWPPSVGASRPPTFPTGAAASEEDVVVVCLPMLLNSAVKDEAAKQRLRSWHPRSGTVGAVRSNSGGIPVHRGQPRPEGDRVAVR